MRGFGVRVPRIYHLATVSVSAEVESVFSFCNTSRMFSDEEPYEKLHQDTSCLISFGGG